MIDGSVLQSAQRCFEKKSRVVVKMVVTAVQEASFVEKISDVYLSGNHVLEICCDPVGGGGVTLVNLG